MTGNKKVRFLYDRVMPDKCS